MKNKPLFQKLVVGLVAGLICGATFHRITSRFLVAIPGPVIVGISIAILIAALIGAFAGKRSEAFWMGLIRYGIAFDLAMFGFQKIFHMQFTTPLGMLDEPFSSFSKEWLTWTYFGRSYPYIVTIALSQITGAVLLVFNRTRLLGVIVLIPVILNIIFIDYFYELHIGVLVHALFLFAGLMRLLMLDYTRLADFFLKERPLDTLSVQTKKPILKHIGRLSIVVVPLLLIATHPSENKHPDLKGKYFVTDMTINGKRGIATSCADSLLNVVYFDVGHECVFEFNSLQRRMFGHYELNGNTLTTNWHFPPTAHEKPFSGILQKEYDSTVLLTGIMNGDSIKVSLRKQKL